MQLIKKTFFLIFIPFFSLLSQETKEMPPPEYIQTVQFIDGGTVVNGIPLIELGNSFEISFDDIVGDEAFYYYKISYHNFDWSLASIPKNEYIDGIDNIRIDNTVNSANTLQIYTHYRVRFPNQNTRRLKQSGNYSFELYNNNDELVLTKRFIVYTRSATIQASVKRSRNLKFINEKQVVQFSINTSETLIAPDRNLKTVVLQNNNLKTAITTLKPQYTVGNRYVYKYDQESSFWGGNEYWNFDNKDVRNATANVSHIDLQDIYHNYLHPHRYRALLPYTYYPDINGNYVIRKLDAIDSNSEAEYVWLHFNLDLQELDDKEVHLYGNFNNYETDASTLMTFDRRNKIYTGTRLFKQGFYNFKYVTKDKEGRLNTGEICGDFDETENEYIIIAYYKGPGDRTDRIIGIGSANSRTITN